MTCRVAIIGLGMVAKLHIQAINSLNGFEVYGLFSRDYLKTQDLPRILQQKLKYLRNLKTCVVMTVLTWYCF